jgi:hypothetical protein
MEASQHSLLAACFTLHSINATSSDCWLLWLVSCLAYCLSMKIETICSSETSGFLLTARSYNPEKHTLHSNLSQNLEAKTGVSNYWTYFTGCKWHDIIILIHKSWSFSLYHFFLSRCCISPRSQFMSSAICCHTPSTYVLPLTLENKASNPQRIHCCFIHNQ